jgi:hypothetical protein
MTCTHALPALPFREVFDASTSVLLKLEQVRALNSRIVQKELTYFSTVSIHLPFYPRNKNASLYMRRRVRSAGRRVALRRCSQVLTIVPKLQCHVVFFGN